METVDQSTAQILRQFIERIERLEEDKAALAHDIREVFAEARDAGFDVKIMRQVLKLRKMNTAERSELEHLLDTYMHALDQAEKKQDGERRAEGQAAA